MEIWKKIEGYENYEVSNLGRVRSLLDNFRNVRKEPLIRKQRISKVGYYYLNLFNAPNRKSFSIHRLVAEYFVPKVEGKNFVNHIDADKLNNKYTNLEWVTPKENFDHSVEMDIQNPVGSRNFNSILSEADVINIRQLYSKGLHKNTLSKRYKVSVASIRNIVNYRSWKHI